MMSMQRVSPQKGGGPAALRLLQRVTGLALTFLVAIMPAANAQEEDAQTMTERFCGGLLASVLVIAWISISGMRRPKPAEKGSKLVLIERRLPAGLRRLLLWNPSLRRRPASKLSRQCRPAFLRRHYKGARANSKRR